MQVLNVSINVKEIFKYNSDFMKQCDIINKTILKSYLSRIRKNMLHFENKMIWYWYSNDIIINSNSNSNLKHICL